MGEIAVLPDALLPEGAADEPARILEAPPRLLDMLPVAIYACDAVGRVRWFNRRAAELWGRRPPTGDDAELFCGAYRLHAADGRPMRRDETPMARVLKTGIAVQGEEVGIERADGSRAVAMVHIEPLHDANGSLLGAINCFHEITEHKRTEARLRDSGRWLSDLLGALPAAVYTTDSQGRITFYNEAAVALWGCRPALGQSEWCGSWQLFWPDGRPMAHAECPMATALKEDRPVRGAEAVAERPDGTRVPFIPYPTPLHDESGALVGAVNMLVDITERKKTEERQKNLLDELNHRVKNTLATVQSIAAQSFRGGEVPEQLRQAFDGRLLALSRTHDHLTSGQWESAELQSILQDALSPYGSAAGEGRVRMVGRPVKLTPRQALILAMTFHELATNAAKYGSLSRPGGTLAVTWTVRDEPHAPALRIDWQESGGPPVAQPGRQGFGRRFVERSVAAELKGSVALAFNPSGVRCNMSVPLAFMAA